MTSKLRSDDAFVHEVTDETSEIDIDASPSKQLFLRWSGFDDPVSGMAYCEVAMSTHQTAQDEEPKQIASEWVVSRTGSATLAFNATDGTMYYTILRCWSNAGQHAVMSSDGILIDTSVSIRAFLVLLD